MRQKHYRLFSRAALMLLTLMMSFTAQTAQAADITQNTAVVINSGNKATYHNKSIAGTVPADSYAGNNGFFISMGAVVVDGIELNLTIDGFNVDYTVRATPVSGISLVNGATLHLTIKGENTLTAGFGGAGIAVPDGCTLEITAASDGTLHATGGKNYGGGAGIGSIGDHKNTNQDGNLLFPQGLGTITINGGIIYAKGGTWYNILYATGGAAGIGSSEYSGATTTDSNWGSTTYINNITGCITINGGTVVATGGCEAAGIGGGTNGTLQTITITGGTVTATPGKGAAAIGIGFNGFTSGSGTLTIPAVSITGGTVKANGSIGFGEATDDSQTLGASGSPIYHITYELNGGKNAAANPEWYEQGVGVASLANPTYKTGYDFAGWYDNADLVGTPLTSIAAGTTGATTLYAKWTRHKYTITYYPNEGTMPSQYPTNYYLGVLTFALPTPTRDGYNFRGWYTNEDFASAKYTQIDQGTYGDFDFYAKWEKWGENDEGSKWNPYKIRTEADLRDLATKVNGGDKCAGVYYQQMGDITITGGDWTPIGTKDNYFVGNFDGGGYTISGISISSESGYQGLFGKVIGTDDQHRGFIQNIVLENSTIAGGNYTGGIVGSLDNGHVLNCHVRSNVTVQASVDGTSSSTKKYFGGVVGYFHNGTVTDCTSMATVDNGGHSYVQYLGGVIGYMMQFQENNTATATNCFSYGMDAIGGRGREIAGGTATNAERVYSLRCSDGSITLPEDVPATDGFLYNGIGYYKKGVSVPLTLNIAEKTGYAITVRCKPGSDAEVTISPDESGDYTFTVPDENKSFTVSATSHVSPLLGYTNTYSPDGTANKPYIINSTEGWNLMCDCLLDNDTWNRFIGKTVKLDKYITVTRMAGSDGHDFCGTFDGQGNTITLDFYSNDGGYTLFRNAVGATIKNLHVDGTIVTAGKYAAGLISGKWGDVTIENCRSSVTIKSYVGGDGTHGGFVAVSNNGKLNIKGCVFDGKIVSTGASATTYCGGFVGWRGSGDLNITNSLYAPAELKDGETAITTGATFCRNWTMPADANSYYTQVLGDEQGTQAYELSAAPELLGEGKGDGIVKTYGDYGLGFDKKYYLTTIPLSETEGVIYLTDYLQGKTVPVVFKREFSAGKASTICLPFAMDKVSGGKVYSFAGITYDEKDGWVATMSETETDGNNVTSTKANTPYVFMPDADGEVTFSGTTEKIPAAYDAKELSTVSNDWTFRGTYEPLKYGSNLDGHVYGFASRDKEVDGVNVAAGEFVKAKDGAGVKPMRCYLTYNKNNGEFVGARAVTRGIEENLPQSITVKFVSSTGNTTAIATLNTLTGEIITDDAWYTLSGTRLPGKPTRRGIYINKGNKVVIR